jgi:ketosteroid isomerase-like protein
MASESMNPRDLLIAAYRAFNTRDLEGLLRLMHSDVDWPNGMEGGRVHGHANVRDYWTRQWRVIDPRVEPVGFSEDGDGRIAVDVHQVVRDLSGKVLLDRMVRHTYVIREGLIVRMDISEVAGLL